MLCLAVFPIDGDCDVQTIFRACASSRTRAVVDHDPQMPLAILVWLLDLGQRQELVAHVDKDLALLAPAQREAEDFSRRQRLVDGPTSSAM